MIRQIRWPPPSLNEPESPFIQDDVDRKLKITFHSQSFSHASYGEYKAIECLLELSNLQHIIVADTTKSKIPYLKVGDFNMEDGYIPITLDNGKTYQRTGVGSPKQWLNISKSLARKTENDDPEVQHMLSQIIIARAHRELKHDLFITLSPQLLQNREKNFINEANPCTPLEAIKIIGLYFRFRNVYTIEASANSTYSLNKGLFYLVLTRHRLPRMWRYFSACVFAEQLIKDQTIDLGQSILSRCLRALEARDQIGIQFYRPQDNDTRDNIMYHFDYLTLLLSGAFDALARVARRVYGFKKPNERNSSFRREDFVTALGNYGATRLEKIANNKRFKDLMILLYELRNTIHGAGLHPVGSLQPMSEEKSLVALSKGNDKNIWEAAKRFSSPEDWGLISQGIILFEPYTYSINLINECFKYINAIADATDVVKLFPVGKAPKLKCMPPKNTVFHKHIRKRVYLLG